MTVRVAWATTCRSDYGASYWPLRDLFADGRFEVSLLVGGAHLSDGHGRTVTEIEADGLPIAARLPFVEEGDDDAASARAIARATTAFADELRARAPDVLVVYGDRYELMGVASAAVVTRTPVAHVCGGDVTEGAIDDQVRHAVTKVAHIHFPSTAASARRLLDLGEEDWRVHLVGDPALDQFVRGARGSAEELARDLGFVPDRNTLVVTFHPPTLQPEDGPRQVGELLAAIEDHVGGIVLSAPAPDPGATAIRDALETFARRRPHTRFVENLGHERYRALLHAAGAMVGNSSSGLNEAPCVPLPAVNVGDRQKGRDRAENVLDAPPERAAIRAALRRALSDEFRSGLAALRNPYGDGRASERILAALGSLPSRDVLLRKRLRTVVTAAGLPRAIGGDFGIALASLAVPEAEPVVFSTGRAVLAAIAKARSLRRWLVPDFMCRVVPDALAALGAQVTPYPWQTPWRVEVDTLRALARAADAVIVPFHMGIDPEPEVWDALDGTGLCAVEDRCHCIAVPPPGESLRGDYAFGSFRKWLPLPDGAYGVAREGPALVPGAQENEVMTALRLAAGVLKHVRESGPIAALEPLLEGSSVELFRIGEEAAGGMASPRASAVAGALLRQADVDAIRRARLANQAWLAARLEGKASVRVVEGATAALNAVPLLALPTLCVDRDRTWQALADHRVFCAVHWRDGDWSGSGGRPAQWAASLLSLPIDQRYGPDELERIAQALD